jgi:hypothetical protein
LFVEKLNAVFDSDSSRISRLKEEIAKLKRGIIDANVFYERLPDVCGDKMSHIFTDLLTFLPAPVRGKLLKLHENFKGEREAGGNVGVDEAPPPPRYAPSRPPPAPEEMNVERESSRKRKKGKKVILTNYGWG